MKDQFPDALFMLEGIEWLKWLVACFFFLLGLFMGWWQWRYRRQVGTVPVEKSKLTLQRSPPEAEPNLRSNGEFGPVYDSEPAEIDDLEQIRGIGNALRSQLYSLGVYKFEQIANWGEGEVLAISKKLDLAEQIGKDKWQEQAKSLQK